MASADEESGASFRDSDDTDESANGKEKTIEERYRKMTQLEHILKRPDTYIGSVEPDTREMMVLDHSSTTQRLVQRNVTYAPGLLKIFDEIIVNASDNKQRDSNMDKLEVTIDAATNTISVKNNGQGIPVEMHKEQKVYVPTMIFGHFLTGSNFDDDEKKTTGGRNGYGAKLANAFSTEFVVECMDVKQGRKFRQVWRNNMEIVEEPIVSSCLPKEKKAGDYVCVTFKPDLEKFKMNKLDDDAVGLLSKRVYDIAGVMGIPTTSDDKNSGGHASKKKANKKLQVFLNGDKLPIKSFQDYVKLIEGVEAPVAFEKVGDRWEIGVAPSKNDVLQQISFVNSICTSKGGRHVNAIVDQIGTHLSKTVKKKNKGGSEIKSAQIKAQMCVFVNCLIENPKFDSQTKETLTSQPKSFGSSCKVSDAFLKKVDKSEIVDKILALAKFKENEQLKKKGGKKRAKLTGIPKLEDANFAGTKRSKECYLILTEGDSAKSLAMSGISVVGRDKYGVFPLKGKPLNVRDAGHDKMMKNEEMSRIFQILGVKMGETYDNDSIKNLRYGHLVIMADQDHDGSHIKGLVINMIHKYWPSLLEIPGFLKQFITPIVKCTKGKQTKTFFTQPEYESWKESTGNNAQGWNCKYYKGLGTSTSKEAKEYFSNLDEHLLDFAVLSSDKGHATADGTTKGEDEKGHATDDGTTKGDNEKRIAPDNSCSSNDLIDMAFNKNRVNDRKSWLGSFQKDTYIDYAQYRDKGVPYSDFVNRELIQFSNSDNARSIPHVMDGLKPSQRKVLFACFKRNLRTETKVAQLAGYIGEHTAYHHGEASLHATIVNLAQTHVGSNNINLLTPAGQFGTRRMGGKDHASPRYIFTALEKITRAIFHPDDDPLLQFLNEDGLSIEPEFYMPVIPMVLVNGADGIGTGWSSKVPNYDPRLIIDNLRRQIRGEEVKPMKPFYAGFSGEITQEGAGKFMTRGRTERKDENTLHISELPIMTWTQDYKSLLEEMVTGVAGGGKKGGDKKKEQEPCIEDFTENHTDTTVAFTLTAASSKIDEMEKEGLLKKFKLMSPISSGNMHLFNTDHLIVRYSSPEAILEEFFALRMEYYVKRKACLVDKLQEEKKILCNKARFVEEVCTNKLVVASRKHDELLHDLQKREYSLPKASRTGSGSKSMKDTNNSASKENKNDLAQGYDYLLGMKIWSLTFEKAEQLRAQLDVKTKELAVLEAMTPGQIWENDLDTIVEALDERDKEIALALEQEKAAQEKSRAKPNSNPNKKKQRRTKVAQPKKTPDNRSKNKPVDVSMDEDSEKERTNKRSAPVSDIGSGKAVAKKKSRVSTKKPAAKPPVAEPKKTSSKKVAKGRTSHSDDEDGHLSVASSDGE